MPITIATPFSAATLAWATVAAGTVKSITASAAPIAARGVGHDLHALEAAMAGADARDLAGVAAERVAAGAFERAGQACSPRVRAISRTSIWPMRPAAPAMAIFMWFPPNSAVGLD